MSRFDTMFPNCGIDCNQCGMLCRRGSAIDEKYASRLAFMLECMIVDYHGHWNAACELLDEYKGEWERVNPSPQTFMGEPMPPDRRDILQSLIEKRIAKATGEHP